ncbi:ABC transporter ATP-binding protein [Egicoccus halophilus]|uniref:ABC transporter ATP-binding protein n=1 Tax=Egicoccus halophilus TaxID=1670830 RepID=A0A8J3AB68_9ACTN|nr:ATP-binding cassette domain-containing protein [Egicoccus halophilus]GGI03855.1 ABC transporter ATP-binding protein [Egicoccus halophilus]
MLRVQDLHKRYGEVTALDGVTLTAAPGRMLGFLGPNGAGKTTTMRAVFGLVRLDAGEVRWRDREVTSDVRLRFGYMPEQRGLYARMPVGRQLRYLAELHGMDADDAGRATQRWLTELGLADRIDARLSDLSHGNQQRVQLAASLVHDPELLVLDEPFSGLDPLGVQAMSEVLRERAAAGATVVFSSHQLELVEELCDDVVIIAHGRDQIAGTLDEVRAAADYRRVEVRLADNRPVTPPSGARLLDAREGIVRLQVPVATPVPALVEELAGQGTIEHLTFTSPRLTEVFRDVVGASITDLEHAAASSEESVEVDA